MKVTAAVQAVSVLEIIFAVCSCSAQLSRPQANAFIVTAQADPLAAFEAWAAACNKKFSNKDKQQAIALFQRSVDIAAAINADPTATYFASVNCLADRVSAPATSSDGNGTVVEEPRVPTGFRPPPDPLYTSSARAAALAAGTASCPEQLDWRKLGAVTGVKDQGVSCSSSWAFAATGAIEAAHYIAYGKLLDLSEGQLVDCLYKGVPTDNCEVHVVGENETCETIIDSCPLTQKLFDLLNPDVDCATQNGVGTMPGQVCVGLKGMPGSGCHDLKVAAAVDGSASTRSGAPDPQLREFNSILQPSSDGIIIPGQWVINFKCRENYTVTLHDTCWKVLGQTGLSEPELYMLNPGIDCGALQPGSRLCLTAESRKALGIYKGSEPLPPPYKDTPKCGEDTGCHGRACGYIIKNPGGSASHACTQSKGKDAATGNPIATVLIQVTPAFGEGIKCPRGNMDDAFKHIMQTGGIANASIYGDYPGKQSECRFRPTMAKTQLLGYTTVTPMDETALSQLLCNQPVAVALTASEAFKLYGGGVFNPPDSACSSKREAVNHVVLLVGYGTDEATGQDYWLAKNSW